jgi:SAM-dependent methyltransferase
LGRPRNLPDKVQRALEKLLWFWPRVIDATDWAAGDTGRDQTPLNYVTVDADAQKLLDAVVRACPDREAPILDVGCNCGRHLIYLAGKGYRNLTGVDAMRAALKFFAERAPDVYAKASINHDLFQRFLMRQPDRKYELTYSHGATIELVHPSFDVVKHLCRVTRTHICLFLHEVDAHSRDWIGQFARHGFELEYGERPITGIRASLVVFRRKESV